LIEARVAQPPSAVLFNSPLATLILKPLYWWEDYHEDVYIRQLFFQCIPGLTCNCSAFRFVPNLALANLGFLLFSRKVFLCQHRSNSVVLMSQIFQAVAVP